MLGMGMLIACPLKTTSLDVNTQVVFVFGVVLLFVPHLANHGEPPLREPDAAHRGQEGVAANLFVPREVRHASVRQLAMF